MNNNSLAHTRWNCKYHIVFAPKFRRKIIYNELKQDIANILSMLCKRKSVHIIEAEVCPDHIHMLVEIPPKMSVSEFVGYLKGKSTLMIFERHANLKYKYGNRHFWCRGYYVDTVGKNAKKIEEYIQNQLKEDLEYDQMSIKEYIDPFTGEPVKQSNWKRQAQGAQRVTDDAAGELSMGLQTLAQATCPYRAKHKPPAEPVVLTSEKNEI